MQDAGARPDLPVSLFDFDLPEDLIALRPVTPRSASRLLLAEGDALTDRHVTDLPDVLRAGDLLVFNDTRVLPAQLSGERTRGDTVAKIAATLIERIDGNTWRAFAKPGKRIAVQELIRFSETLSATVLGKEDGGTVLLQFSQSGASLDAALHAVGAMPLPPYIAGKRAPDERDEVDYQTVFAREAGAVAAPTAALHFDAALLKRLEGAGVSTATVTLHVGAGTFLPVKAESTAGHKMHSEVGSLNEATAAKIAETRAKGGRIIAVGTTVLRVLETAAQFGDGPWAGATDIFITPGYEFRAIDGLMTNFHLPRSTLMMLVSALMGVELTQEIYRHAIAAKYRFYSYGDASLLLPHRKSSAI